MQQIDKYDREEVQLGELQVGDLFIPPMSFVTILLVKDTYPCKSHDGWLHLAVESLTDNGPVRGNGQVFHHREATVTMLTPKTSVHTMSGKEFLAKVMGK